MFDLQIKIIPSYSYGKISILQQSTVAFLTLITFLNFYIFTEIRLT